MCSGKPPYTWWFIIEFDIALRDGSPIVVTIVSFWHFAIVRGQTLTPSIAFTSVSFLVL